MTKPSPHEQSKELMHLNEPAPVCIEFCGRPCLYLVLRDIQTGAHRWQFAHFEGLLVWFLWHFWGPSTGTCCTRSRWITPRGFDITEQGELKYQILHS